MAEAVRWSAMLVIALFVPFGLVTQPVQAATLPAPSECTGFNEPFAGAASIVIPGGEKETYSEDTLLRASTIRIDGTVRGEESVDPGKDGVALCIVADVIEIAGVVCTGAGADGRDVTEEADGTSYTPTGETGGSGGALVLAPGAGSGGLAGQLTISPDAEVCTGGGGAGGDLIAMAKCSTVALALPTLGADICAIGGTKVPSCQDILQPFILGFQSTGLPPPSSLQPRIYRRL